MRVADLAKDLKTTPEVVLAKLRSLRLKAKDENQELNVAVAAVLKTELAKELKDKPKAKEVEAPPPLKAPIIEKAAKQEAKEAPAKTTAKKTVEKKAEPDKEVKAKTVVKTAEKTKVEAIMIKDVITIQPDADIYDALMLIKDEDIRQLPVLDGKKLVGLLTVKDILKIQPQLFELVADKISLREESLKPVASAQGTCDHCSHYSKKLYEIDAEFLCQKCMRARKIEAEF